MTTRYQDRGPADEIVEYRVTGMSGPIGTSITYDDRGDGLDLARRLQAEYGGRLERRRLSYSSWEPVGDEQ